MNQRRKKILIFALLSLALQACNLQLVESQETSDLEATITAQALLIQQGAPNNLPVEQVVVLITATPDAAIPVATETVVPAPIVAISPAAGVVTITVSTATNCRTGPGQNFSIVYGMPVSQVAEVVGKNTKSGYWIIKIPGKNGQTCWLWGQYAVVNGDTSTLKEVVTPTTLAAAVTPTATFTPPPGAIAGCTDSTATNYNSAATVDNGSCTYIGPALPAVVAGCMDPKALNYDPNATIDNGSCTYPPVVTKPNAPNIFRIAVGCYDSDGDGIAPFVYEFSWEDNSNNETGFAVSGPDGDFTYPANTTFHQGSFDWFVPFTVDVRVTAFNDAGQSTTSTDSIYCSR